MLPRLGFLVILTVTDRDQIGSSVSSGSKSTTVSRTGLLGDGPAGPLYSSRLFSRLAPSMGATRPSPFIQ